jgi:hypothetical protein
MHLKETVCYRFFHELTVNNCVVRLGSSLCCPVLCESESRWDLTAVSDTQMAGEGGVCYPRYDYESVLKD